MKFEKKCFYLRISNPYLFKFNLYKNYMLFRFDFFKIQST